MKILFILDLYKPHIWWVEILFENIITRLHNKWHQIIILTSKYDSSLESYEKHWNIEIFRVGHNRYDFMIYSLYKWYKLAKKVDIIHSTTYNSAIPSSVIWFFSGKKVILTVHEVFWKLWYRFIWWKWFFFKLFEDLIFKFKFSKYLCVSNYTKNSIRLAYWINDEKLVTVYNGIDYDKWDKFNYDIKDINEIKNKYELDDFYTGLYFWRPGISKWLEYYIKAIPKILKNIPNFKAILIVPESDKNRISYINSLIKEYKIENNIIWIWGVDNTKLWGFILSCDFTIVPSLAEWFWFAAVEVCSLWKKLIASEIASLPEVVSGKINFIDPWSTESIVSAVIKFKENNFISISDKRFEWDDNINKTLNIYNSVLWKNDWK